MRMIAAISVLLAPQRYVCRQENCKVVFLKKQRSVTEARNTRFYPFRASAAGRYFWGIETLHPAFADLPQNPNISSRVSNRTAIRVH